MKRVFFVLIFVWAGIAGCNVVYNMVKSVSEVKEWAFLSDSQRRQKAFGAAYDFTQVIAVHTPQNATILLYTTDTLLPLLSRYYLYPRVITMVNNKKQLDSLSRSMKFDYLAVYDKSLNGINFTYWIPASAGMTTKEGVYKRK
jgi:hypothetical protein